MAVYSLDDVMTWQEQTNRIWAHQKREWMIMGHCDVLVNNSKAYVFYFVDPVRQKDKPQKETASTITTGNSIGRMALR